MTSRSAPYLLGAVALLTALIVQPGEMGSIDTISRLQSTHAFWTRSPIRPETDAVAWGLIGRGGFVYSRYGMGQSLLMLPSDILATNLCRRFWQLGGTPQMELIMRSVFVSYATSTLVCLAAILVCFRFLRVLDFSIREAVAGSLTLLLATTFLHYTQNLQENNYLLLMTLTGMCFQYEWVKTGSRKALALGSLAFGWNLLTRMTTALDIIGCGALLLLYLWFSNVRGENLRARLWIYLKTSALCYAPFLIVDRVYQYHRFGNWFNTYFQVLAVQERQFHPELPASYPYNGSLWQGLLGPFLTPEKSVFLFDPMILVTLGISVLLWKRLAPQVRAYVAASAVLLSMYVLFYAKLIFWSGDFAWGDRYITTPVELLALISVPLMLRHRSDLKPMSLRLAQAILVLSVAIQAESTVFWHCLELYQMKTRQPPTFVVGLRLLNIVAVATDHSEDWGLNNEYTLLSDPVRNDTPYFWPFLVRRTQLFPPPVGTILISAWGLLLVLFWISLGALWRVGQALSPANEFLSKL
jgi:hypothetical protein